MICNLKVLSLATGAVLTLSGLSASPALATSVWFEGESGIQTITAEQEVFTEDKFTITESSKVTSCEIVTYTMPPQSPSGHAMFTHVEAGNVTINTTLTGIKWTEHDERTASPTMRPALEPAPMEPVRTAPIME